MSQHRRRRETPIKRKNPSGKIVWVARYTDDLDGGRRKSAGTFRLEREAQAAIDRMYDLIDEIRGRPGGLESVGDYFAVWPRRHPRPARTQATNEHRVSRALDVRIDGQVLRYWPYRELRRRHALALVDELLAGQGRSRRGALHIIRALGVMTEDAITDEVLDVNPFRGVKIRPNDPRITKAPREIRVWSIEQMHAFAAAARAVADEAPLRNYEPLVRTFADTMMRLGEVLPLRRADLDLERGVFHVRRTAHEGTIIDGTKTDHGELGAGRIAPCPPGLAALIRAMPRRIDTDLLFPTPSGRVWRERNFYRDVWYPTQATIGLDIRPHEMRHSLITHLQAAGVDPADLAQMAGHTVATMVGHYTHALGRSIDQVREVIG